MAGGSSMPLDALLDRLRSSGSPAPPRPFSNPPTLHHQTSQRSSLANMPQSYGFDYSGGSIRQQQQQNDPLLATLESLVSAHPHGQHQPPLPQQYNHHHHHLQQAHYPQFASIESQSLYYPQQYSNGSSDINRQLGNGQHGHSGSRDQSVPQNFLLDLLKSKANGSGPSTFAGTVSPPNGRRSADNIPQMPQRFEPLREGARSTGFADSSPTQTQSQRQSQNAHDLVSSLLGQGSAPVQKQPEQAAVPDANASDMLTRSIMSPPPQDVSRTFNPQELLTQLLSRGKPATGEVNDIVSASIQPNASNQSPVQHHVPDEPEHSSVSVIPDTAPSMESVPTETSTVPSKPLFTYVNPFEQLSATNPRNRNSNPLYPKSPNGTVNMANMPTSTADDTPLTFPSPPHQHDEEVSVAQGDSMINPSLGVEAAPETEHDHPQMQPYVEDVTDPFEDEVDPFEGDTDPFDETEKPVEEHAELEPELETTAVHGEAVEEQIEHVEQDQHDREELPENTEETIEATSEFPQQEQSIDPETLDLATQNQENGVSSSDKAPNTFTIYKFPMKPFSQIMFGAAATAQLPSDNFNDIARMARTADQIDRNLIAASKQYIVYAMGKSKGGVRIIRQEDGQDLVLMKESAERTVNVTLGNDSQILAIGVNGTVLWSELGGELREDVLLNRSFLFPPSPLQDQNGGLTKSRAHLSTLHPKVFALGRGKIISLIHADIARQYTEQDGNVTRVRDEAYHANHSRTIDTGKVSKEFCFSEDDTTLVTVDKAGKLKFWDVTKLIDFDGKRNDDGNFPSEASRILTEPIHVYSAVSAGETCKATSVMFVDKLRPYDRKQALRYLLVGLQQNHVLQLWDIAIGRAVQELRFPQSSTTDALCSLAYHHKSGVIVAGNPNRNTISFIHLSTPKYNLQPFSQAGFVKAIQEKSPNLPKLDATAIMSSVVEFSFEEKGQILSVEIMDSSPVGEETTAGGAKVALFELYICHTKGMTCLPIFKEDIGFDANLRVSKGVDAVAAGLCTISPLAAPVQNAVPEASKPEESKVVPVEVEEQPKAPVVAQTARAVDTIPEPVPDLPEEKPAPLTNGQGRKAPSISGAGRGKKPRRDVNSVSFAPPPTFEVEESAGPSTPQGKRGNKGKDREEKKVAFPTIGITPELLEREVKKIEEAVTATFTTALGNEIGSVYRKFDEDRRIQQVSSDTKQEAVLRMISSTLVSGMEAVLAKLVQTNISTKVVPEIKGLLSESLTSTIPDNLSRQMESAVPKAVEKTVTSKPVLDSIVTALLVPMKKEVETTVRGVLQPALDKITKDLTKNLTNDVTKRTQDALKEARKLHEEDGQKIAKLTTIVSEMTKAFSTMEAATSKMLQMQQTFITNQEKIAEKIASAANSVPPTPATQKSEYEVVADDIDRTIKSGDYEAGILIWLQSREQQDIYFENSIVRYNPQEIIPKISQVVVLTVAASVTGNLNTLVDDRLNWLEVCLYDLQTIRDEQTRAMLPRITAVLVSRLQQFYMTVAEENPGSPVLKRIHHMHKATNALMRNL